MRKNLLILLCCLYLPAAVVAGPADNIATLEVLPGWRTSDGDHMAGLRLTLAPGWKTYWRAPGDAGIPPEFSFAGSDNIAGIAPYWPVPQVFDQAGVRSIGYYDSVVFPIRLKLSDPDAAVRMSGVINIGVCQDICVPVTLQFDATLPMTGSRDAAITAAIIDRPLTEAEARVGAVTCAIAPISDGLRVTTRIQVPPAGGAEVVVVEAGDANVWVSEADVTRSRNQLNATVDMVHTSGRSFALDRSAVRITVLGQDRAIDIRGCAAG